MRIEALLKNFGINLILGQSSSDDFFNDPFHRIDNFPQRSKRQKSCFAVVGFGTPDRARSFLELSNSGNQSRSGRECCTGIGRGDHGRTAPNLVSQQPLLLQDATLFDMCEERPCFSDFALVL